MRRSAFALVLLVVGLAVPESRGASVEIRATTAAITVQGGGTEVSARLFGADGAEIPGLAIERGAGRVVVLLMADVKFGARIEVDVPSATDLRVEASNGGPVIVRGVRGHLEIVNSNAPIVLEDVGGNVLASTSNGSIDARLTSIDPSLPMSFLTSNGAIDVTFPADLRANLRLESDTGTLTTEFELAAIGEKPIEWRVMRGGRLRSVKQGAVRGGGAEILLRTENAPVTVHRAKG